MGRPVEVRVLSRAVTFVAEQTLRSIGRCPVLLATGGAYLPDFLLAAQRAFISCESLLRPAAVSWPFLLVEALAGAAAGVPRVLAQRARAAAESFALVAGEK